MEVRPLRTAGIVVLHKLRLDIMPPPSTHGSLLHTYTVNDGIHATSHCLHSLIRPSEGLASIEIYHYQLNLKCLGFLASSK